MLSLKQGLSLESIRLQGKWSPDDETSLVAWYQNAVGITLNGSDVSAWADSSSNSYDMVQADATEQPAYSAGTLTFASANKTNLQTAGQISLTGDFTIGIKCTPTAFDGSFLADNTTSTELFKFISTTKIKVKIDSANVNLDLDSGTFGDDYLVITRISNVLRLYHNGVIQASNPTAAGTSDIDAIGIRSTNVDGYDGDIEEIQIYSSASAALTANINDRLSGL
tara:strand:+ start:67 stop:738 length:672 start_codon:yes stop_codon:yes gene_type:complete